VTRLRGLVLSAALAVAGSALAADPPQTSGTSDASDVKKTAEPASPGDAKKAAGAPEPPRAAAVAVPSFTDLEILDKPAPYFRIEQVNLRYTHFDQSGTGYQSRAGISALGIPFPARRGGPGSEWETVEQPQAEIIARQGDRITHRIWLPADVVTAASPDAIDVVSTASRTNESGSIDWTTTYKASNETSLSVRSGMHNEENWTSWTVGFVFAHSFAEDNTVLEAGVSQITDWFDKLKLDGEHDGHTSRSSSGATVGLTQILTPTTIAHADYGLTLQRGQLSNGWNIVPLTTGDVALEILPKTRLRHALAGRLAQWLPWNGAVHGFYRFYIDDWGIRAHTFEVELYQRVSRISYLRLNYRYHLQTGADFFTTRVAPTFTVATADSDLAPLDAQTLGVKGAVDLPVSFAKNLHADLAVERYFRSNDLRVSVYSCGLGFLF
jgi:hypothetical protein